MTVSRDWPKTLRSTTNFTQEQLDATNLCSGGSFSNILLTTTNALAATSGGGGGGAVSVSGNSRNATIHHIPIYHPIGHIPLTTNHSTTTSSATTSTTLGSESIGDCGPTTSISFDHHQSTAAGLVIQQHPATIHHQFLGASANFLNFAIGCPHPKGLGEQQFEYIPNPATVVGLASGQFSGQNEKKVLVLEANHSAQQPSGMGDESLDQKFFVFHNNHVQSSPPPPPNSSSSAAVTVAANALSHPGGSLNVLSLSAASASVHHPQTHHSLHQNSLPLLCANATASLSAIDALHTAKEQKVSVRSSWLPVCVSVQGDAQVCG